MNSNRFRGQRAQAGLGRAVRPDHALEATVRCSGRYPLETVPAFFAAADAMLMSLKDEHQFHVARENPALHGGMSQAPYAELQSGRACYRHHIDLARSMDRLVHILSGTIPNPDAARPAGERICKMGSRPQAWIVGLPIPASKQYNRLSMSGTARNKYLCVAAGIKKRLLLIAQKVLFILLCDQNGKLLKFNKIWWIFLHVWKKMRAVRSVST